LTFRQLNFSIIKLALFLIVGIQLGIYLNISINQSITIIVGLILLIGFFIWISAKKIGNFVWIDVFIYCATILLGIVTVTLHDEISLKTHYSNFIPNEKNEIANFQFIIKEQLKPSRYHEKYIIEVTQFKTRKTTGKVLFNVAKDSSKTTFNIDDKFVTESAFELIRPALNPYQFDYKSYLERQYIHHQVFVTKPMLFRLDSTVKTPSGLAALIRRKVNKNLNVHSFTIDELAIINALLLGQRQDISKEIYDNYSQAGAIHILAVSGLHVGIILLLLNFLFKPLEFIRKGKYIKIVVVVLLLWCYAIIAGLSASVVRAVTMFTVFAIAMNLKRPSNVYNTLAISAFVLLLLKPNFLFEIGFQMSYLAVLAIVTIQPLLSALWQPKLKVVNFFWRIITVTVAAQFGVIPISLYYFHQFPGLFFVSNLVIIPCLGAILGMGILVIILSLSNSLPNFLASLYGEIISLMNDFVGWIALQESFLIQNIHFEVADILLSYFVIISGIITVKQKVFKNIVIFFLSIISFQTYLLIDKFKNTGNKFVVFHKSRYTIIGIHNNRSLTIHHNIKSDSILNENLVVNYEVGMNIKTIKTDTVRALYFFKGIKLLAIDSLAIFNVKSFQPEIILLRNSPKINLLRLIDSLKPELIISDGSNYKSYEERWAKSCRLKKIPFHQTSEKGAFILSN